MARQTIISGFIPAEEAGLIEYLIRLVQRPGDIKAGLQRLCQHLENGTWPQNEALFKRELRALILDGNISVRRWAYKGLALLGDVEDVRLLVERMPYETDPENLTWMMSAILGLSDSAQAMEVCRDAGVEFSTSMALAAYLYGENAWLRIGQDPPQVKIDAADPLTLKWCALLAGYGRAPENLMHPRIDNGELLGELNHYPQNEVAEYSVWALWRAPEFSRAQLKIPLHELLSKEENVRRWIYRLLTLDADFLEANADLFQQLTADKEVRAREGLALGIRDITVQGLRFHVMQWLNREQEPGIQELLLEHLATSPTMDKDLNDFLYRSYVQAAAGGGLRRRLRSAVSGRHQSLFQAFSVWDAKQKLDMENPGLFDSQPNLIGAPTVTNYNFNGPVSGQNQSFGGNANAGSIAGRDVNAQNSAAGDILVKANQAIAEYAKSDPDTAAVLGEVVKVATSEGLAGTDHENALLEAATRVAEEPTKENKATLWDKLKVAAAAINVGHAATKLPELIAAIGAIL